MKTLLLLATCLCAFGARGLASNTIDLGTRLELFVDHHLIERLGGVSLRLHPPVAAGVAFRFDQPWEGAFSGYVTVLRDGDVFRAYYRGLSRAGRDGSADEVTCYAESRDGRSWRKPNLQLFEVHGTRDNNVVLAGQAPFSHNFAPFLDRRPGVPAEERYKALAGTSANGLLGFVSADGLRWRKWRETPLVTQGAFDSQNVAFWSEAEQVYLLYLRTWTAGEFEGFRTISRTTSPDFLEWSEPVEMSYGAPREHLYTSQTHPYFRAPHLYVALPMRFLPGRKALTDEQARALGVDRGYVSDCAEAVFMTSRGGTEFTRTFMEGYIRPGLDLGNWASRAGLTALGWYPPGSRRCHFTNRRTTRNRPVICCATRCARTGSRSVNAPYRGGEFVTKALSFAGRELVLNVSTSAAGSVRVEIQDAKGQPLPGYTLAEAVEIIGDSIERVVAWNSSLDLSALAGRPVRLRFVMKDADIYSVRFRE